MAGAFTSATLALSTKEFTTSDGTRYTYDHSAAATVDDGATNTTKPTFLFFHGFPSSRHDWAAQVEALTAAGYGVIAPDLLGFGETDKPDPENLALYSWRRQSGHIGELLDAEAVDTVIGVGHDWGTSALGRAYNYNSDRFSHLVFILGFIDVDAFNAQTLLASEGQLAQYGYWYFFNHFSAEQLISDHLESFYSAAYTPDSASQGKELAHLGAARAWLTANKTTELASWDSPAHKATWFELYTQPNAVAASLNPYRRAMRGTDVSDDNNAIALQDKVLNVPVTLIGGTQDTISPAMYMRLLTEPVATQGLEEHLLEAGHWVGMERATEVNDILLGLGEGLTVSK
ncbi:Alpha/Beta hydrolase protein [Microdochium trichocladiopsis]|uniref:Alpha/Beta hydrolase protein n=1 Tax=Microdochium trichocladiopsis TaxID=1682393 RepID=A0A9P8XRY8_9PEZI|nr:Alpha/Beta hydrolase protein [Microdochium trichocladiopsis]KAH7014405.1 Alpha/Beta hydrolase protein [Microdochium trichocladiopsis]